MARRPSEDKKSPVPEAGEFTNVPPWVIVIVVVLAIIFFFFFADFQWREVNPRFLRP